MHTEHSEHPAPRPPWSTGLTSPPRRRGRAWLVVVAVVLQVVVCACLSVGGLLGLGFLQSPGRSLSPAAVSQSGGLPTLHRLDWGLGVVASAKWSPDGQWIAVKGGPKFLDYHLAVVSPDGHTRIDLTTWPCDQQADGFWGYAWLPDNRLSCITSYESTRVMCIGAAPFTSCETVPLHVSFDFYDEGAVWSPDGRFLMLSAPTVQGRGTDLYILDQTGHIVEMLPFGGFDLPTWIARTSTLSYLLHGDLVESTATFDNQGQLTLGQSQRLVPSYGEAAASDFYAWSPSGHWLVICYEGGKFCSPDGDSQIRLINPEQPLQTLDVVQARDVGQSFLVMAWSPDGRTLIVTGHDDGQPYALDMGAYLESKGLTV